MKVHKLFFAGALCAVSFCQSAFSSDDSGEAATFDTPKRQVRPIMQHPRLRKHNSARFIALSNLNEIFARGADNKVRQLPVADPIAHNEAQDVEKPVVQQQKPTLVFDILRENVAGNPLLLQGSGRLEQALLLKQQLLQNAAGKEAVAVIGSRGAGISTIVNLLGEALYINNYGGVETLPSSNEVSMGIGFNPITKYPECMIVPQIGRVYDLPGFEGTEDALEDLVKASLIYRILATASEVRMIFVTSWADIQAVRGSAFKKFLKIMEILPDDSARSQACMLVVNQVEDRERKDVAEIFSGHEKLANHSFLSDLLQAGKVVLVPRMCTGDKATVLDQARNDVIATLNKLKAHSLREINLSITLNGDTRNELLEAHYELMKQIVVDMKERFYPDMKYRVNDPGIYADAKQYFDTKLVGSEFLKSFGHLIEEHYHTAYNKFDFKKEHDFIVQELQIDLLKKEKMLLEQGMSVEEMKAVEALREARQREFAMQRLKEQAEQAIRSAVEAERYAEECRRETATALQQRDQYERIAFELQQAKQDADARLRRFQNQQEEAERKRRDAEQHGASLHSGVEPRGPNQMQILQHNAEVNNMRAHIQQLEASIKNKDRRIRELESFQAKRRGGMIILPTLKEVV